MKEGVMGSVFSVFLRGGAERKQEPHLGCGEKLLSLSWAGTFMVGR